MQMWVPSNIQNSSFTVLNAAGIRSTAFQSLRVGPSKQWRPKATSLLRQQHLAVQIRMFLPKTYWVSLFPGDTRSFTSYTKIESMWYQWYHLIPITPLFLDYDPWFLSPHPSILALPTQCPSSSPLDVPSSAHRRPPVSAPLFFGPAMLVPHGCGHAWGGTWSDFKMQDGRYIG